MMTTPAGAPRTAFLDTNALLHLFSFWEACEIASVRMDAVASWQALRTALGKKRVPIAGRFEKNDFDNLWDGLRCFRNMDAVKGGYDFFSCLVCRSELHRVVLAAKAADGLRRRRIPNSLSNKRPLIVYRRVLTNPDYAKINKQLEDFFEALRVVYAIDIRIVEDHSTGPLVQAETIFDTARELWSRVLTETMDAYIYAAAIEVEADYFLTSDAALRGAARDLSNPTGEWVFVARGLRVALSRPTKFKFPDGVATTWKLP